MAEVPQFVPWLISAVLLEAAVIDGRELRVPNWLTFHLAIAGLGFSAWSGGTTALWWSLGGLATGLVLLLPLYAIGGMGAGDVKLLAGVGAWVGPAIVTGAFVSSALVGGLMALVMIARSGNWIKHYVRFQEIGREILTVRNPVKLSETAAARKPEMLLLPYAIPIATGSILYFAWMGMMF